MIARGTDGTPRRFNQPIAFTTDASGNVYAADTSNHTIRKITAIGVSTLARKPGAAGATDGVGAVALFGSPASVAVNSAGNVYLADSVNRTIRKITPTGADTTLATGFRGLSALTVDGTGIVYVADSDVSLINKRCKPDQQNNACMPSDGICRNQGVVASPRLDLQMAVWVLQSSITLPVSLLMLMEHFTS